MNPTRPRDAAERLTAIRARARVLTLRRRLSFAGGAAVVAIGLALPLWPSDGDDDVVNVVDDGTTSTASTGTLPTTTTSTSLPAPVVVDATTSTTAETTTTTGMTGLPEGVPTEAFGVGEAGEIVAVDVRTGETLRVISEPQPGGHVAQLHRTADGRWLYVSRGIGCSKVITRVPVGGGTEEPIVVGEGPDATGFSLNIVGVSADGAILAYEELPCDTDGQIATVVLDVASGQELHRLPEGPDSDTPYGSGSLALSPDGRLLLTAAIAEYGFGDAQLVDVATGATVAALEPAASAQPGCFYVFGAFLGDGRPAFVEHCDNQSTAIAFDPVSGAFSETLATIVPAPGEDLLEVRCRRIDATGQFVLFQPIVFGETHVAPGVVAWSSGRHEIPTGIALMAW